MQLARIIKRYKMLIIAGIGGLLINYFILYDYWKENLDKLPLLLLFACLWAGITTNSLYLKYIKLREIKDMLFSRSFLKLSVYSLLISPLIAYLIYFVSTSVVLNLLSPYIGENLSLTPGEFLALLAISIPLGSAMVLKISREIFGEDSLKKNSNVFPLLLVIGILSIPIIYRITLYLKDKYVKMFVNEPIELRDSLYNFFLYCPISGICSSQYYISLLAFSVILLIPLVLSRINIGITNLTKYGNIGLMFIFMLFPFAIEISIRHIIIAATFFLINIGASYIYAKITKLDIKLYPFLITRFVSLGIAVIFLSSYVLASVDYQLMEGSFEVLISYFIIQTLFARNVVEKLMNKLYKKPGN